jgi:hypothetical protein
MADRWPDFFITGPGRSGTTSLARYLDQHPDIYISPEKEPRFFDEVLDATEGDPKAREQAWSDYHALFEDAGPDQVVGEGSVTYVYSRPVLKRIREHVPTDPKFVVSYRDPIERAYSLYWLNVAAGRESEDFTDAVIAEITGEREEDTARRYVRNGRQGSQLQRLYDGFGEDRVHMVLFEDVKNEPDAVLRELAHFLRVDPEPMREVASDQTHNAGPGLPHNRLVRWFRSNSLVKKTARLLLPESVRDYVGNDLLLDDRKRPPMPDEARRILQSYFEPEIARVEDLLGRELPALRASFDEDADDLPRIEPAPSARRVQEDEAPPPKLA